MKEIKSYCKKGLVPISDVFGLIMKHLETEHCQVRISSFQVGMKYFRTHMIFPEYLFHSMILPTVFC